MAEAKKTEKVEKAETTEKVYIVETPVANFCGVGAGGVQFAYGKAEVHEGWVLDWFKEHGYKVTPKK
jgi:hypothetical protein